MAMEKPNHLHTYGSAANGSVNPYEVHLNNGLPPGTDAVEQLTNKPRMAEKRNDVHYPVKPFPTEAQRKGKWMAKYFASLDPQRDYDEIIRINMFFRLDPFQVALGYNSMFAQLVETPAGADAIYNGKMLGSAHQRYYETVFYFLEWANYGSDAQETVASIEKVNKLHAMAWAKSPGVGYFAFEAQMAIIALSYFETFVRKTVGASMKPVPEQVQQAWPIWSARITSHFRSEKGAKLPNFGVNYPRTFDEIEKFFWWWEDVEFDKKATPQQRQRAHLCTMEFERQFCELFFPPGLSYLGKQVFRTFLPPKCRMRNRIPDPNPIVSYVIKCGVWAQITLQDKLLPDPSNPPLMPLYDEMLGRKTFRSMDAEIKAARDKMAMRMLSALALLLAIIVATSYLAVPQLWTGVRQTYSRLLPIAKTMTT